MRFADLIVFDFTNSKLGTWKMEKKLSRSRENEQKQRKKMEDKWRDKTEIRLKFRIGTLIWKILQEL